MEHFLKRRSRERQRFSNRLSSAADEKTDKEEMVSTVCGPISPGLVLSYKGDCRDKEEEEKLRGERR